MVDGNDTVQCSVQDRSLACLTLLQRGVVVRSLDGDAGDNGKLLDHIMLRRRGCLAPVVINRQDSQYSSDSGKNWCAPARSQIEFGHQAGPG